MGQLRITLMYRWIVLCIFSLSLCHNAFSAIDQGKMKVTLEVTNKPRGQVLHMLEKQVGVIFFYASHLFNTEEKISISAVDKTLDEVLERVFDGTGMVWSYDKDKIISVKPKKEAVIKESAGAVVDSNITSMTVRGKVVSANGTPIPGATVIVKNSSVGDVTDAEGNFSVMASKKNVLLISSIGYETREISVSGQSLLAQLNLALSKLDETVIVAYGSTTQRLNTGDVGTVKAKDISKQPVSNPMLALQGRVSGLLVTQQSGVPGGGIKVELRGQNSINNGNDPLYIIDGVPYEPTLVGSIGFGVIGKGSPLNYLDPMNIESIDVLKDADATAIYGSRGANGVIIISTKRGGTGRMSVEANVRSGFGKVSRFKNLLNKDQFLEMRREAFKNDNRMIGPLDYDLNGTWDTTKSVNWQKELIGGRAGYNDYQASVMAGTESLRYSFGLGYHRESSVFPGNSNDSKYSLRFNINNTSKNDKIKLSFAASYLIDLNKMPKSDLTNYIYQPPLGFKKFNTDGTLNWENSTYTNPYSLLEGGFRSQAGNLVLNSSISYKIFSELKFMCSLGYTSQSVDEQALSPLTSIRPSFVASGTKNSTYFNFTKGWTYNIEPQIDYSKSFNRHKLSILLGSTILHRREGQSGVIASGFASDDLLKNISAASVITPAVSKNTNYRYNAVFGRLNYNYADKYLLQFTGRRDGSSRFGPGKQFANFGAIGAAWIFTSEDFGKSLHPLLSYGKIRASYGITGNDQIGDYQYLDLYYPQSGSYQSNSTLAPGSLFNNNFAWEKNEKLEAGLDIGLFSDRLLLSVSYYRNRSGNQLVGYPLPTITGFYNVIANLPAVVQNKGIEIQLNTTIIKTKEFTWSSALNLSFPRNKLLSFPDLEKSGYQMVIGQPINVVKLFRYDRVNPNTGIYQFLDSSGKSTYNPDYNRDRNVLLSSSPKYFGGFENTFTYKNIELSVLFQYVKKMSYDYTFSDNYFPGSGTSNNNQFTDVMNRWMKDGDQSVYQRFSKSSPEVDAAFSYIKSSDRIYSDGSFLRCKNIQISYNLTSSIKNNSINSLIIFAQCQNLFTLTKYKGLDPESENSIALPPLRMYSFGINLKL